MSVLLDLALLATSWTHVLLAPYTKVEESFNLHATHDILAYGVDSNALANYDHFVFPGAVPRSFVGSLALAGLTVPVLQAAAALDLLKSKFDVQIAVRIALATINSLGLALVRRATTRRFGFATGALFVLITATQFHLPFWMGRSLPNMFALFPVNVAISLILSRSPQTSRPTPFMIHLSLVLLAFSTIVLRAELLLLTVPLAIQAFLFRWTSLTALVQVGTFAALGSIAVTMTVDSYFWDRWPLWPELNGLYFNVFQGKSADWGTSPVYAYVSTHIPKLLLSALPLSVLGALCDPRIISLLIPVPIFVALISILGHKEWRFVIYIVPIMNVAAARGARWLLHQRKRSIIGRLCVLLLAGLIAGNMFATYILTFVSSANYPGGEALARFNELYVNQSNVHVHIGNYAAQTGASLFLQANSPPFFTPYLQRPLHNDWVYNKTENLTPLDIVNSPHFTHAITEDATAFEGADEWKVREEVWAFDGFRILRDQGRLVRIKYVWSEKLWIAERM
ncbi:alpha-1,6-mannosyltransferase subunit [Rickenella mellea]|uniref:Mannosyltransferase n=1 Tax=Rickenella mellea TaxID=50990 RepID=A0A4Y7QF97_9AGAM|nr:alpha-1,6-mannosyltransferase subunit [Rickenella mellea]